MVVAVGSVYRAWGSRGTELLSGMQRLCCAVLSAVPTVLCAAVVVDRLARLLSNLLFVQAE